MLNQKLQRVNLVSEVRRAIKEQIICGQLKPGTPLRMEELTRRLGVSSSPIREALRLLEQDHLVQIVPFQGAYVRRLDHQELLELYEIRKFLEIGALQKGMPSPPAELLARLQKAHTDIQQALRARDQAGFLAADMAFHETIVDMAGNQRMSEMFCSLTEQGQCFVLGRERKHFKRAAVQHADILQAISSGDVAKATRLLEKHFRETIQGIALHNWSGPPYRMRPRNRRWGTDFFRVCAQG